MSRSEYQKYLDTANSIFERFRMAGADLRAGNASLEADHGAQPQSAFLIAYLYPAKSRAQIGSVSESIGRITPSIVYGPPNGHVTITDYRLTRDVRIHEGNPADLAILHDLTGAVETVLSRPSLGAPDTANFGGYLCNGKAVIAPGVASEAEWDLNQQILLELRRNGLEAKGSWASHSTVARFTSGRPAGHACIGKLLELLETAPELGRVELESIDVGYFNVDGAGFHWLPFHSFPL